MALVLSLKVGQDFFVGHQRFVLDEIHGEAMFRITHPKTEREFEISATRAIEIMPEVFVSAGQPQQPHLARVAIMAPGNIVVLRGQNYRNPPAKVVAPLTAPDDELEEAPSTVSQGYRDYEVDTLVLAQARQLGLYGNVERRIARMARFSAPITHKHGNFRFESWILRIQEGRVVSLAKFDPSTGKMVHDVVGQLEERHRLLEAAAKHLGEQPVAEGEEPEEDDEPPPAAAATADFGPRRKARGRRSRHR